MLDGYFITLDLTRFSCPLPVVTRRNYSPAVLQMRTLSIFTSKKCHEENGAQGKNKYCMSEDFFFKSIFSLLIL
jgi:hypothetical protein